MKLKSLGYRTDLIFNKLDGEVIDRGNHLVVRTLSNPNFFWGNLLIFETAPKVGDITKWKDLFKTEFTNPAIYHMTFAWDEEKIGDIKEFEQDGFKLEKAVVLSAKKQDLKKPPKFNTQIQIGSPKTPSDWEEIIQIQLLTGNFDVTKEELKTFYQKQMLRYQKLISLNLGVWFCARLDNKIVGSLGVFKDYELGRFQIVSVHPDYQRRGICGAMVYQAAEYAFSQMGLSTLVMIADAEYHAANIYKSVGFSETERIYGVCKH